MARSIFVAAMVTSMTLASASRATVNVLTVPIGNAGNAADPATGSLYGAVGYSYQVGKFEVTAAQYTEYLNAVGGTDTGNVLWQAQMSQTSSRGCLISRTGAGTVASPFVYTVPANMADRPVNWITFPRAVRFANWMHNAQPTGGMTAATTESGSYDITAGNFTSVTRSANADWVVPSEDEWYKAAYHKNDGVTADYFAHATSSDATPLHSILATDPGNDANYGLATGTVGIDGGIFTTIVGEFENSGSPYGTFDQAGNEGEWTDTISGSNRIFRGGDFMRNATIISSATREPSAVTSSAASNLRGFRLAFIPSPSAGVLLSLAGLTALRRRR